MNDSKILGQLVALLNAGLSFHHAERAAKVSELSAGAAADYGYLRAIVLSSGGQPAQVMERVRKVIEERQAQLRRVELANASPKATARLVLWLPITALVLGQFTGMGSIQVLLKAPLALSSVLLGAVLLAIGSYWSARMLKSARLVPQDDAIYFDGISIALSAGVPTERAIALARIDDNCEEDLQSELREIVELSKTTGAALSKLLIEKADSIRGEVNYKKALALEKLSVRLMIPLGATVLPAFALIAIVPLAMTFLID